MKKLITVIICINLIIGCDSNNVENEADSIQDGTIEHPYLIENKTDLYQMRDNINSENGKYGNKVYKLIANIDLKGEPDWMPIGNSEINSFKGIFLGNNFQVSNIRIGNVNVTSDLENAGFFGFANNCEIENLKVIWEIMNSSSLGGGIVAIANGAKITSCITHGKLFAYSSGGIAGKSDGSHFKNCQSETSITCQSGAGIAIFAENSLIENCSFIGEIVAKNTASGIAIEGDSKSIIDKCFSDAKIYAEYYANGIAHEHFIVKNSYSSGNISAKSSAFGIAKLSDLIINCYTSATILALNPNSIISSGYCYSGGIASNALIINCYSCGDIIAKGQNSYAAGILTDKPKGIMNCYSSSNIKSEGSWFSHLAGIATNNAPSEKITNCLALNKSIVAINPKGEIRMIYRIANAYHDSNNNYSNLSDYYSGTSDSDLMVKKFIDDKTRNGTLIDKGYLEKLNNYVILNPIYQGVSLYKWKVQEGKNGGMPIFDN